MLEGRGEVHRVYEVMASEGVVEPIGEKHLGLFKTTRYPEKDHTPEAALLHQVQAALGLKPAGATPLDATLAGAPPPDAVAGEAPAAAAPPSAPPDATTPDAAPPDATPPSAAPPAARTTALIALLQAAGLLSKLFPEADQERAIELVKNHWPSRAVEDELRLIRLGVDEASI